MESQSTAAASRTLHVSNLSAETNDETLSHFFSFCGKIEKIEHAGAEATVVFVKESAARTGLMLNGGTLQGATIAVSSADPAQSAPPAVAVSSSATDATGASTSSAAHPSDIEQEEKPRSAIAAEYLAHGYVLSDQAISHAIAADQQYGISSKFLSFFTPLASKVQTAAQPHVERAQAKLAEVDEKQGLSVKAAAAATIGTRYYQSALNSPVGSKVLAFYSATTKNLVDVHEEAKRIAEHRKMSGAPGVATETEPVPSAGTIAADAPASEKEKPLQTTTA